MASGTEGHLFGGRYYGFSGFLADDIFAFYLSLALYIYAYHLVSRFYSQVVLKQPVCIGFCLKLSPQGVPDFGFAVFGLWEDCVLCYPFYDGILNCLCFVVFCLGGFLVLMFCSKEK